jgi:hypothetical protein
MLDWLENLFPDADAQQQPKYENPYETPEYQPGQWDVLDIPSRVDDIPDPTPYDGDRYR